MTIYDQDFVSQEAIQAQYPAPGVTDSAAVNQEASIPHAQEQVFESTPTEQVGNDKDYNFRALREELAQIKEDRDRLREDFEGLRRNQVQRQPEAPRKRAIDDINPDDLVTGAQFKQALAEREAEYQLTMGELLVKSQNPDYDEVTAKYGIPLIEKEPDLANGFLNANAASRAAYLYKVGKMAQDQALYREMLNRQTQYQSEPAVPTPQKVAAQRMVENASKPGTLSAPTGGAGNLSKADYYATMSDKDFYAMVNANLGEI